MKIHAMFMCSQKRILSVSIIGHFLSLFRIFQHEHPGPDYISSISAVEIACQFFQKILVVATAGRNFKPIPQI